MRIQTLSVQQLRAIALGVLVCVVSALPASAQPSALSEARRLYNLGRYEEALAAAAEAQQESRDRHGGLLIAGRAGLERYRQTADVTDLRAARDALRAVDIARLDDRDRVELVIGLGQALYHDDAFRPAARMFESAMAGSAILGPAARDQLLDWWATAMDRHAQTRVPADRAEVYEEIARRMDEELVRDPTMGAAAYWTAVAARSRGDLELALDLARAGWVRAQLTRDRGAWLRPDLDRLVLQGIIPERVKRLDSPSADPEQATTTMVAEWESFKKRWTNR